MNSIRLYPALIVGLLLVACGGGGGGTPDLHGANGGGGGGGITYNPYSVSGTVTGLHSEGLVLRLSSSDFSGIGITELETLSVPCGSCTPPSPVAYVPAPSLPPYTFNLAPVGEALNPVTHRNYLLDSAIGPLGATNGIVRVIDTTTHALLSTITVGVNPVALAVNPIANMIYVVNNPLPGAGSVTIIDGVSGTTSTVNVGIGPRAIAINRVTNKIYVANYGDDTSCNQPAGTTVTAIDGATKGVSTVTVGSGPYAIAVNSVTDKIYVTAQGKPPGCSPGGNLYGGGVSVIDGATNGTTTVTTADWPGTIVLSEATNQVYVMTNSKASAYAFLTQIDGVNNTTTTNNLGYPSIASYFSPMAIDQVANTLYIGNGEDVITVDGATGTLSNLIGAGGQNFVIDEPSGLIVTGRALLKRNGAYYRGEAYTTIGSASGGNFDPANGTFVTRAGYASVYAMKSFDSFTPSPTGPASIPYTFTHQVPAMNLMYVQVATQPKDQICAAYGSPAANGGSSTGAPVTNIGIICYDKYDTVTGTITGLTGAGLSLVETTVSAGGVAQSLYLEPSATGFSFFGSPSPGPLAGGLPFGAFWAVAILSQPVGQTCILSNASGSPWGGVLGASIACQ